MAGLPRRIIKVRLTGAFIYTIYLIFLNVGKLICGGFGLKIPANKRAAWRERSRLAELALIELAIKLARKSGNASVFFAASGACNGLVLSTSTSCCSTFPGFFLRLAFVP